MKNIVCLTPRDARYGFGNAGVRHLAVDRESFSGIFQQALDDPENGVVIVDERLVAAMEEKDFHEREKRFGGIVVVLPAPEKEREPAAGYAEQLIRRAIGYQVRLSP